MLYIRHADESEVIEFHLLFLFFFIVVASHNHIFGGFNKFRQVMYNTIKCTRAHSRCSTSKLNFEVNFSRTLLQEIFSSHLFAARGTAFFLHIGGDESAKMISEESPRELRL